MDTDQEEMSRRFMGLVMMQAQQAAAFMGLAEGQDAPPKNLELARIFIDQLEMLRVKTRNNLSADEDKLLGGVIGDLQFNFVRASSDGSSRPSPAGDPSEAAAPSGEARKEPTDTPPPEPPPESESKKKFSKSYGT